MSHPLQLFSFCPVCGDPRFVENNVKSKKCLHCGFVYYFNPSAAVVAFILNEKGELLVCSRGKEPAKGTLDLPGGFVDMYETGEEALCREVKEEIGLEVDTMQYCFSLPNLYLYSGFEVQTLDMFFVCNVQPWTELVPADDVAEAFFLPTADIDVKKFGLSSIQKGLEIFLNDTLIAKK
ncbi:MAG: NUDIX domain-containing protein [Paludibacteraceae bacterium]|nr:NUDIX domain-containing protein [Paludibacteraceae bacterium]